MSHKFSHLVLCALLAGACSSPSTDASQSTSDTTAITASKETAVNSADLSTFRHVDQKKARKFVIKDEEQPYYVENTLKLFWPVTLMGKTPAALHRALLDALSMSDTPKKYNTLDEAIADMLNSNDALAVGSSDVVSAKDVDKVPDDAGFMTHCTAFTQLTPTKAPDGKLFVMALHQEVYSGGAHGMYWTNYINYDMEQQRVLKITDLVTDTARLAPIITKALLEQENAKSIAELNENGFIIQEDGKVPVTDNFYVDEFNLHFVYPPYSITCYARGEADVTVPYYMLDQSDLATPYLNELLEHYTR